MLRSPSVQSGMMRLIGTVQVGTITLGIRVSIAQPLIITTYLYAVLGGLVPRAVANSTAPRGWRLRWSFGRVRPTLK